MTDQQADSILQTVKKKSLRPVLVASEDTFSWYSVFLEYLLCGLSDESAWPVLVCPQNSNIESIVSEAVNVIRYPLLNVPLMDHVNKRMLIQKLTDFKPTVIHCLCQSKASLTRYLARHLDLPYVLNVNMLRKKWEHLSVSAKRCAKIIVPEQAIAENFSKAYPRFAQNVEHINMGTFVSEQCRCFSDDKLLPTMITIDSVGEPVSLENLLTAVKNLVIDGYEFAFAVISTGKNQSRLRKLLASLDLTKFVTVVPKLSPSRAIVGAGDIFILHQRNVSFNPLLLEAMSVGTAVAVCSGAVDDLIIDGETSIVFDSNDELSIRKILQDLLNRHEFARQIAQGGKDYVKENHSANKMVSAILRIYREVA